MNKPTRLLITIGTSAAIGAIAGILYATEDGARIRRKIAKGCSTLMCVKNPEHTEEIEELQDMKSMLQDELELLNEKIEKLSAK